MTKRYVKSDIVDCHRFTAGKAYEAISVHHDHCVVVEDDRGLGYQTGVVVDNDKDITCLWLDWKATWQWCDKSGNTIKEE